MERALNDQELDELDAFLSADDLSDDTMDLSTLDGFLAAVVLNPGFVMPGQWLPWIWDMEAGEESPAFENAEQAERIHALLMRHYNHLLDAIADGRYAPLLYSLAQEDESEFYDAEGWCMGFMLGVRQFLDDWQPIFDEHPDWLAPMLMLGTEEGWEELEASEMEDAERRDMIRAAYESLPKAVDDIFQFFLPEREAQAQSRVTETVRRSGEKVGRNDPCPCGSGLKFKKCCGAGPTLH